MPNLRENRIREIANEIAHLARAQAITKLRSMSPQAAITTAIFSPAGGPVQQMAAGMINAGIFSRSDVISALKELPAYTKDIQLNLFPAAAKSADDDLNMAINTPANLQGQLKGLSPSDASLAEIERRKREEQRKKAEEEAKKQENEKIKEEEKEASRNDTFRP